MQITENLGHERSAAAKNDALVVSISAALPEIREFADDCEISDGKGLVDPTRLVESTG
jgi:hypothetical protein